MPFGVTRFSKLPWNATEGEGFEKPDLKRSD